MEGSTSFHPHRMTLQIRSRQWYLNYCTNFSYTCYYISGVHYLFNKASLLVTLTTYSKYIELPSFF